MCGSGREQGPEEVTLLGKGQPSGWLGARAMEEKE